MKFVFPLGEVGCRAFDYVTVSKPYYYFVHRLHL